MDDIDADVDNDEEMDNNGDEDKGEDDRGKASGAVTARDEVLMTRSKSDVSKTFTVGEDHLC